MKTKYLLILLITMFFVNCNKEEEIAVLGNITHADIYYTDEAGNDLLDTTNINLEKYIDVKNIETKYLIDGKEEDIYFDGYIISRWPLRYREDINRYVVSICCYIPESEKDFENEIYINILVKISSSETDTLIFRNERLGTGIIAKNIWYNSILKYDNYDNAQDPVFEVIK
ncbi:MAG: hypothetical protein JXR51_06320 [Bacteroidales bacterium]|nr:hypothetical protein [Bacteroidales bacterium]MBN2756776.1 hypothetical protein [Bacteroidales bacterium]